MPASPPLRAHARRIWHAGVEAADPLPLLQASLRIEGEDLLAGRRRLPLSEIRSISVVGAGKAAGRMAHATEKILGSRLLQEKRVEGWVNVPDGTVRRLRAIHLHGARRGHENQPSQAGLLGTRRILDLVSRQGVGDMTLCLLSGGGSALLPGPAPGVPLSAKRKVTAFLHAAGASIEEVNAVRKHLSTVKGGGLIRAWRGAWFSSFMLSDVEGDRLDVIASGPTAPDPTRYADAVAILKRYDLWERVPRPVRDCLLEGMEGRREETLKELPTGVDNILIGSARSAVEGAAAEARRLGYRILDVSSEMRGEASRAGERLAQLALGVRDQSHPIAAPACLLASGETTVSVGRSAGKGGRAQELVLAAVEALKPDGAEGIAFLCAGTDGEDGPTDAAGAFADESLLRRARRQRLDPADFLSRHDAYNFFDPLGGLLKTGPTGTNVMDLAVVLVAAKES